MLINKPTIKEQVEHMCGHVWGTWLEQINILSIAAHSSHCNMMWSVVQPISLNLAKLPHIIDEVAQEREEISHIELFHHNGHIDAIVSLENGKCILKHKDSQKDDTNAINILN